MSRSAFLLMVFVAAFAACSSDSSELPYSEPLDITEVLASADTVGYARAVEPREFVFPADHGPHPRFRSEWWYYTGNLRADEGRRFGFQLTFFRTSFVPKPIVGESAWRSNQLYMGHFGLSDVEAREFHAFERFSRAGNELAGAQAESLRIWIDDWSARGRLDGQSAMRLTAKEQTYGIDLELMPTKGPVLQGDAGLSRKGVNPGNASYYYSFTRMQASGVVALPEGDFPVTGTVWMDREWSTSALEEGQVGWDWFALQFDDQTELMYYGMRRTDGSRDVTSSGSWIDAAGNKTSLSAEEVDVQVLDSWNSPRGGRYPSRWRLRVQSQQLDVEIRPVFPEQELDLTFRYWEGAVDVTGVRAGRSVSGVGYVELTGYVRSEP